MFEFRGGGYFAAGAKGKPVFRLLIETARNSRPLGGKVQRIISIHLPSPFPTPLRSLFQSSRYSVCMYSFHVSLRESVCVCVCLSVTHFIRGKERATQGEPSRR